MKSQSKCVLKDSQHLKKNRNKIEANIGLHTIDKFTQKEPNHLFIHKPSFRNGYSSQNEAYFTPKTRQ